MGLILVAEDNTCFCNCSMKCVVQHKTGSMARCTKLEIENAGFQTVQVKGHLRDKQVIKYKPSWWNKIFKK